VAVKKHQLFEEPFLEMGIQPVVDVLEAHHGNPILSAGWEIKLKSPINKAHEIENWFGKSLINDFIASFN